MAGTVLEIPVFAAGGRLRLSRFCSAYESNQGTANDNPVHEKVLERGTDRGTASLVDAGYKIFHEARGWGTMVLSNMLDSLRGRKPSEYAYIDF